MHNRPHLCPHHPDPDGSILTTDNSLLSRLAPHTLFAGGCLIFVLNLDMLSTGDTIYYANIIDARQFAFLAAHQGYYMLGFVFASVLGPVTGISTDQSLAVMSAVFAAGCLSIVYVYARRHLPSSKAAFAACTILVLSHRFLENAITAEIYIVQAFFLWLSYLLFEDRRFIFSGLALAFALWVTPLTLPFCFWYIAAAVMRRYDFGTLVRLAVPVAILYGAFLALFYAELLWGNRGLMTQDENRSVDLLAGLSQFVQYQFKHYSILNLLLIPALLVAWRQYRYLLITTLAAALPNLYVISQLRSEDNVFILPLDIFFALWITIGALAIWNHRTRIFVILAVALHGALTLYANHFNFRITNTDYLDSYRELDSFLAEYDNSILVSDWTRRMAYVYANRPATIHPLETGFYYDKSFDIGHIRQFDISPIRFSEYDHVFVLESWDASPHGKLLLPDSEIDERRKILGLVPRMEDYLDRECAPVLQLTYALHECTHANEP